MLRRQAQRTEAAQLAADRRRREDEAPRLSIAAPRLLSLSLSIGERRPESAIAGRSHIRRIVVEHAPALFVVPCSDADCGGAIHDITHSVMHALTQGLSTFEIESPCYGCSCVLRCAGKAVYRAG